MDARQATAEALSEEVSYDLDPVFMDLIDRMLARMYSFGFIVVALDELSQKKHYGTFGD